MTDIETRWERGIADADVDSPAADPVSPEHDEWAMDEALQETFPASDPPLPMRPGSSMSIRYARRAAERTRRLRIRHGWQWAALAAAVVLVCASARRIRSRPNAKLVS
ncbi:MAG: hypothetical protein ACXWC0_15610 [Burkholderiales bacterium]